MQKKYFIICLTFALWTIIQTACHLVFVIYAYYMSICEESPTQVSTTFFYLTYLYNKDCPHPKITRDGASPRQLELYLTNIMQLGNNPTLQLIVQDLLEKLDNFPDYANVRSRTTVFLLCFLILDGTWIVSAVALLMGVCFAIKESLSLIFYGPWLVMTMCMCLFDAAATILFGLDIAETTNFASWFKFVGIDKPSVFDDYDSLSPPPLLSATPSVAVAAISSRFIFIWFSNLIGFFLVLRATVSVFRESYKNDGQLRSRTFLESPINRSRSDHDTSAARIRNWQLFYGAIDTTTSDTSERGGNGEVNSNKEGEGGDRRGSMRSGSESRYYFPYPDVAESVVVLEELRGQLPWSYTREGNGEERIAMEGAKGRLARVKSTDSSTSGTEL